MIYLQKETGIEVHWNFFATAHGKEACDGIGGTVKRLAHRASLQRREHSQITTPKGLFEWAVGRFENISFAFSTTAEYERKQEFLKSRFSKAVLIKNTRKFHSFETATEPKHVLCKIVSNSDIGTLCRIERKLLCITWRLNNMMS